LLGIFTAAAADTAYGHVIWKPIEILGLWMEGGSHGGRAAAAFGAIGLIIVTLGINISANSISAANDLMSFCPKYINIRRGQLLAAVIGSWGFVPVSRACFDAKLPFPFANLNYSGKFLHLPRSSLLSSVATPSSWVP
jgi:cytosine/uracil/thiamine/allantoin permease